MEDREQERRQLFRRIEQLEKKDNELRDVITKEKAQYSVCDVDLLQSVLYDDNVLTQSFVSQLLTERDILIENLTKRYESMREDFAYNLRLIEQRDAEIGRLNRCVLFSERVGCNLMMR